MNGEFSEESDKITFEIVNAVYQKKIILVYKDDLHNSDVIFAILSEILSTSILPLIWVCWMEPSSVVKDKFEIFECKCDNIHIIDTISNVVEDDSTVIHSPKNYSGILIDIKKFIRNKKHILVLDILDIILSIENKNIFIRFLSSLLNVSKDSKGTVITSITEDLHEPSVKRMIYSLFDVVLHVSSNRIHIESDIGKKDFFYEIKNGKLLLRQFPVADIAEINEIFNITTEEITRLDETINKHVALFKGDVN